jgi:Ca-activated chloride channel family protein
MTTDDLTVSRWRRPLFITAGLSLLAVGALVNLSLLSAGDDAASFQAVASVNAPAPPAPTAGTRHKGEEGRMGRPSAKRKSGLYAMKGPANAVPTMARPSADERYGHVEMGEFIAAADDAKSTFSVDVDTAAYSNMRRYVLQSGALPPADAVRTEELINYFDYAYPQPSGAPFSVTTETSSAPWNPSHRLVHIGIQGREVDADDTPARNLVFLVDVSGSMKNADKLPLLKKGLAELSAQMNSDDRISLVVYAGAAGTVLEPTPGDDVGTIVDALHGLEAGGSTNGAAGIHTAYAMAREGFIEGGINRVIIATDGDFNVGTTDHDALVELIEAKRETGISLSVLGFGRGNLNDHLMEQLADKGNGNYAYIDGELEAHKVLVNQVGAMLQTIAKDVKLQVEFDPAQVASHRLIGYENRVLAHADFTDDSKDAGEIGAGHTVTALYEVVPTEAANGDPLGTLNLRYKAPDGARSKGLSVPLTGERLTLEDTSDAYRFSAAVAMFGQKLRHAEAQHDVSYQQIVTLAAHALGDDPDCYRHQFLEIATAAGRLSGETVDVTVPACTPSVSTDDTVFATVRQTDWGAFALEVLRVLPPLLALPMFVLAFRRPRRRPRA